MTIGFLGLGKMGRLMVSHLLKLGVSVAGWNRTEEVTNSFVKENDSSKFSGQFIPAKSHVELLQHLNAPRVFFLMIPEGKPVDEVLERLLSAGLSRGDIVIDGGNSFYKDSMRRAVMLKEKGISYIDCGTSGGLTGASNGACLMLGGEKTIVDSLSELWEKMAVTGGWAYLGSSGAGHFVKMVHNGVEYGIDQALGEGVELLSKSQFSLDLPTVIKLWNHGSVIRGWLTELLGEELAADPNLQTYKGNVGGGTTGGWTVAEAKNQGIDVPVIETSLLERQKSKTHPTMAGKTVSSLRHAYGGHKEPAS
ncbi:decarboxylating 6-phosphogluconate dehydrogenase [Candidatus Gottesmanbacteria bacterium]|nr:decarboxylating 6-phosphogluconate dehydrogenase [Candidatus Gottesmanbacteria bacterium]